MTDEGNSDDNKKVVLNLSQRLCSDTKRLENGVAEERALLDTGGSRVNNEIGERGQDKEDDLNGMARSAGSGQVPPPSQPSQGMTVCWERFLHLRSLRVLLVENDDCTRHVVAALLRNCSYEVVEASNGIQAWRILEDITNHIDLVLTEVVLPCFMGISLLSKIMSHESRKNLPVIMMSSHDSMDLVFKCLSKGAVDFLVKPIRKNELKNLWQHVWRRCHSSSGSGSESGTHTQKSVKSKSVNKYDNSSSSNDEQESGSPPLDFGGGSDHGSGTQSSWTKQVAEDIESPRPVTPLNDLAECPDSTCAQFIHDSALPPADMAPGPATKEGEEVKQPLAMSMAGIGLALEVSAKKNSDLQPNLPPEVCPEVVGGKKVESNAENACGEPNGRTPNVTGSVPDYSDPPSESKGSDAANKFSKISDINDNSINESLERSSVGQNLKRLREVEDAGKTMQEQRNVLRLSESSAFSRYNAVSQNKVAGVDTRSPFPLEKQLDGRSEMRNVQSCCGSNAPNQFAIRGGFHVDVTSLSNNEYAEKMATMNTLVETPTIHNLHPGSVFQRREKDVTCSPKQATVDNRSAVTPAKMFVQPAIANQVLRTQDLFPFDNHQHPVCNVQPLPPNHDKLLLKDMAASTVPCGSSNIVGGHVEGDAANYSVNGSGSGSGHGSNHGSCTAANAGGINMESDNGAGGKSGDASGSGSRSGGGSGSGNKMDPSKLAQREAALNKFRQKRKERCYNRKVRYQSRKKLAEQRPRVRGQFVRQMPHENGSNTSNTSMDTDS